VRFKLKPYQEASAKSVVDVLRRATRDNAENPEVLWAVSLSAPTGAGKTVIASAVIEQLFEGSPDHPEDPLATVLWVTDDPSLNEQTKRKMMQAASALTPSRLVTITSDFDQETFDAQRVYFLNIQKLARTNPLSRSNTNMRTTSLWQTIANTIASNGSHFYVVIDEAHRGMRTDGDRRTIVSRIINGHEGVTPPAPIVWGISATPQRFREAIDRWEPGRTQQSVSVPIADVRSSGLLKDLIILDNPVERQRRADTTLIRAAARKTLEFENDWSDYAQKQDEPAVRPVLVLQVPNTPSDAEISDWLDAITDDWPGLVDNNIVNTFGEHTALAIGGRRIRYLAPQDIQDDLDARVVLAKDAVSTGWDCPRAEVLVSLRSAEDYTYISQLIGRMVRSPLARRISTNAVLNTVNCYLPHFNRNQVEEIADRFRTGENDEPPVSVETAPVRVWRNEDIAIEVFELLEDLPTYVVPGKVYRTQVARAFSLATLLSGDSINEDAVAQTRERLLDTLAAEQRTLTSNGELQGTLEHIRKLRVERSYALLSATSIDDLPPPADYDMELDAKNVDDLFRVARRKFPEGLAQAYWDRLTHHDDDDGADDDDDDDLVTAKATVAALALHPAVVESLESTAEQLVRAWLKKFQRSISQLPDARKAGYEPIRQEAREAERTVLVVPDTRVVSAADSSWPHHVLVSEDGRYPVELRGWEESVLTSELADQDLVAWYRNPTGGPGALRVPYNANGEGKALYPDFIFMHRTDAGVEPSIVDPHGYHLADAAAKLRGLATYAELHGASFARIDAVIQDSEGALLALDLKSESVREAIQAHTGDSVLPLFQGHGGSHR